AIFSEEELRLATEWRVKYLRVAKDLNSKNLDRLRNIFYKNSCRRLDTNNYILAVVLQIALGPLRPTPLVDISDDLRTSLVEEYINQKKPTDEEIYLRGRLRRSIERAMAYIFIA
ncbi:uncharacterized protein N7498_002715, partial [Penicillium cinerascens]